MTEKIIKFPDKVSSIWKDVEKYYDKAGYSDEEKEYAKKINREIIERYDGWDFDISIDFQDLNIKDKESFARSIKESVNKQIYKNLSDLLSQLVGQIIGLKVIIYRLRNGSE